MKKLFAMNEIKKSGMICVEESEAKSLNQDGWGIFHCVNELDWSKVSRDKGRQIKNILAVNYWTCETDNKSKDEQLKAFNDFLTPSLLIESKRSIHAYWAAVDAHIGNYKDIQLALAKVFSGDRSLQNLAHTLRTPGFYHWKDPQDPFLVKKIYESSGRYSESSFVTALEHRLGKNVFRKAKRSHDALDFQGTGIWEKLNNLNQGELLLRMNGFQGEQIEIRGNQVFVDGQKANAWIDERGMLGGYHGPTVYGWIRYFGFSKKESIQILKSYFPELED